MSSSTLPWSPAPALAAPLAPWRLRFGTAVFAAAWVFVATVPLLNAIEVPGLGTIGKIAAVPLVALVGISVAVAGRSRRLADAHLLMLAFWGWAAASTLWSIDQATSLRTLWTLSQLLLMVWLVWEVADTRERVVALFQAYVVGAAGSLTVLLSQAVTAADAGRRYTVAESHPNSVAFVLTLGIPIAWYLASQSPRRTTRVLNRLYAVLAVPGILLTGSRSALVAGSAALLIVPACARRTDRRAGTMGWVFVAVVALVAAVPLLPEAPLTRIGTFSDEVANGDLNGRVTTWGESLQILGDAPVAGVGTGAARIALLETRGWEGGVHNTYLSVAVDLGTIGLAAFLLIGLAALIHGRRARGPDRAFVAVLMTVVAVGLLPRHWDYERPLWLMIALVICLGEAARRRPGHEPVGTPRSGGEPS